MPQASTKPRVVIVVPARYASTRLPGKPLADIWGKPMIQHVYERAAQVPSADLVVIATDDERVAQAVRDFGGTVAMTSPDHPSGTDRLGEVMQQVPADLYVNLQGDEPLVRPADVERLVLGMLEDGSVHVGTLCHAVDGQEALDPNTVKVVLTHQGDALYFSRAPIPYPREKNSETHYLKHVGVYAYRRDVLAGYKDLPPSELEQTEKLEQLRLLAAGMRIRAFQVEPTGPGVDTPECLERVRAIMAGQELPLPPSLADVRLVITDVDGVMTDGGLHYTAAGESYKTFHVRDGMGIRMLEACGIRVAIVSGRDSDVLRKRASDLGVQFMSFGVKDKALACEQIMQQAGIASNQTACLGDDSIDLPAFATCGISFAVADAPDYIRQRATHILKTEGGKGALREAADAILAAQGKDGIFRDAATYRKTMEQMAQ